MMTPPQEINQLQSNLTLVFDKIGLIQELDVSQLPLNEFSGL